MGGGLGRVDGGYVHNLWEIIAVGCCTISPGCSHLLFNHAGGYFGKVLEDGFVVLSYSFRWNDVYEGTPSEFVGVRFKSAHKVYNVRL